MKTAPFLFAILLLLSGCDKLNQPDKVNLTILASTIPAGRTLTIHGTYSNNSGTVDFIPNELPTNPYNKSFEVPNNSMVTVITTSNLSAQQAQLEILINGKTVEQTVSPIRSNGLVLAQIDYFVSVK